MWNINILSGNCQRAHHNSRIARACVLYREGGFLQGSLCCPVAKQPSQHWCSCGDSKAMRKGSFKGADPMLSPLWCQWDKSRQRLMYRGAIPDTRIHGAEMWHVRDITLYFCFIIIVLLIISVVRATSAAIRVAESINLWPRIFFFFSSLKHGHSQQEFVAVEYSLLSFVPWRRGRLSLSLPKVMSQHSTKRIHWQRRKNDYSVWFSGDVCWIEQ